jgi:hypothetical protein
MVGKKLLKQIEKDFSIFKSKVLGILLFGSVVRGDTTKRSDIDICLVVGNRNVKEVFDILLESDLTSKYDVKIFETLPLKLKGEILENNIEIWAKDEFKLSYYLHKYRKIWEDQKLSLRKLGLEIFQ